MAKFIPFLGNVSGKLKSVVFAYNKSGSYIRSWRASTKPFSLSQINAQAFFAAAVTTWHSLTDSLKGQWNNFATTIFHAKHPVTGMAYSGYNAFVSMKNQADNMAAKVQTLSITDPVGATFTADFFTSVQTPPSKSMGASILDAHDQPLNLMLGAFRFSVSTGTMEIDLNLIGDHSVGTGTLGPQFVDSVGQEPVGIAVYGSTPGQQVNQFVPNPEFGLLCVTPPIGALHGWTDSPTITLETSQVPDWNKRKVAYAPGDVVQAKAFLVAKDGRTQPLNAVKFNVDV
jgi:hypothetical protein